MRAHFALVAALLLLAACGQSSAPNESGAHSGAVVDDVVDEPGQPPSLPEVDPALVAAPSTEFTAIEPTEVGVSGAPSVMEALEPLLGPEMTEGGSLALSVNAQRDEAVADIVRTNLADDSVAAGHVRIEFRREPDGWYPTNAYRRSLCVRGALANQWTKELCP